MGSGRQGGHVSGDSRGLSEKGATWGVSFGLGIADSGAPRKWGFDVVRRRIGAAEAREAGWQLLKKDPASSSEEMKFRVSIWEA